MSDRAASLKTFAKSAVRNGIPAALLYLSLRSRVNRQFILPTIALIHCGPVCDVRDSTGRHPFRVQSLRGPEESHLRMRVQKVGSFRSKGL